MSFQAKKETISSSLPFHLYLTLSLSILLYLSLHLFSFLLKGKWSTLWSMKQHKELEIRFT